MTRVSDNWNSEMNLEDMILHTPVVKINSGHISYYAKLEGYNYTGSIKDKAAFYVIDLCYKKGMINKDTTIIESSSGNFGIALASVCKTTGNRFISVVDPMILQINKQLLQVNGADFIYATQADRNGSYLNDRLRIIRDYLSKNQNTYWVNQYDNEMVCDAYFHTIGNDLCQRFQRIDYVYAPVSTGGTITGISQRIKQSFSNAKIIAVDVEGSVIFQQSDKKRHIPGMGSCMRPENLKKAIIDEVVIVSEREMVAKCRALVQQSVLAGASSGGVAAAIDHHRSRFREDDIIIAIFVDRGERYLTTVYDDEWCRNNIEGWSKTAVCRNVLGN